MPAKDPADQSAALAERYSAVAAAYDELWSPIIRLAAENLIERMPLAHARAILDLATGTGAGLPAVQRAAPSASILGADLSAGMLRIARNRHPGPLALMDAQRLALATASFDAVIVAYLLFMLPSPSACLAEVWRVLRPAGVVGTITWESLQEEPAATVWDEELRAAGACSEPLPATENEACCDSAEKMRRLMGQAGFHQVLAWTESIEHFWRAADHFRYQVLQAARVRLESLEPETRERCLQRVRARLMDAADDTYVFRGSVVLTTGVKPAA